MKKIEKSIFKHFPVQRLYKEDIEELVDLFKQNYKNFEIVADGYKLNDIVELNNIKNPEITDFEIYTTGILHLTFSKNSANLYIYNDEDINAIGVGSKIEDILFKRRNWTLNILTTEWIQLPSGLILGSFIGVLKEINVVLPILILLIYLFWLFWSYKVHTNKYTLIYLIDSPLAPSFLKKNKDSILVAIIGAFAGSLITVIIMRILG